MLLTVGQRKFSARIRFYSRFNYVNSRDPDVALSSTNTVVRTEAKRSSLILPPPSFFHDSTLPSPLFWHQKVHVDAVDRRRNRPPEPAKPLFLALLSPGWVSLPSALCSGTKPRGGTRDGTARGRGGNRHRDKEKAGLLVPVAVLSASLTWLGTTVASESFFLAVDSRFTDLFWKCILPSAVL